MSAPLISPSRAAEAHAPEPRVHLSRLAQTFSSRTPTFRAATVVQYNRSRYEGIIVDPNTIERNVTHQFVGFAATGFGKVGLTLSTLSLLVGGLLVSICSR